MAERAYSPGRRNQHTEQLTTTWLTPPWMIEALGPFDTDLCCPGEMMPWSTASTMISEVDDCLSFQDWKCLGFKWLNPPYGKEQWKFIERLAEAGDGIALIRARTNVIDFHRYAWSGPHAADYMFFGAGAKLTFHDISGAKHRRNDPLPYVLLAWGVTARVRITGAMERGELKGTLVGNPLRWDKGYFRSNFDGLMISNP
jgi:hypothetical protein